MTAALIIIVVYLLAKYAGEVADFHNMKAGQRSAPTGARFMAGLIVIGLMAAVIMWSLLRRGMIGP